MPLYCWKGVSITGQVCQGIERSRSLIALQQQLWIREIGLMTGIPVVRSSIIRPIRSVQKIDFFKKFLLLTRSGVYLDQVLEIIIAQISHTDFKNIMCDVRTDVQEGVSLHEAMGFHPYVFSPLVIHLIYVGYQTGTLVQSLEHICAYLDEQHQFYVQVRSAVLLPLITFLFFLAVLLVILVYIVPVFASMFISAGQPMPAVTQWMLWVSQMVCKGSLWRVLGLSIGGGVMGYMLSRYISLRTLCHCVLASIPYVNRLSMVVNLSFFLRALSVLLASGIDIVSGIAIARSVMSNKHISQQFEHIEQQVAFGASLSEAIERQSTVLFSQEVRAIIHVGEQSGNLAPALSNAAASYQEQAQHIFSFLTTVLQPILMIILGLLIAGVIFCVYVPIFNLSYIVR